MPDGYRTIGKLNKDWSNAILFPTWFGGLSKVLVVYTTPGGIADSTRYFVALVDALGNGFSSSPSNSVQQPFSHLSTRDMVNSQYQLITGHLKPNRPFAVMGVSMGSMQALQWRVPTLPSCAKWFQWLARPDNWPTTCCCGTQSRGH
jgi:homoserine O-acetyltransferase